MWNEYVFIYIYICLHVHEYVFVCICLVVQVILCIRQWTLLQLFWCLDFFFLVIWFCLYMASLGVWMYRVLLLPVTMKFSEGFYTRSQIANRAYATMGNVKMQLMATPVTVMRITTVPIATTSSTTVPPYLAWMEIVTITRATVSMGTKGPIVRNISIVAPIQVVMAMGSARKSWDHLNVNVMVCSQSAIVFSKQHCSVVALRNLVEILTLWASLLFESIVIDLLIWLS